MIKNKNEKNYHITIVGGGLTGKLMASILVNSKIIPKKNCVGLILKINLAKMKEWVLSIIIIFLNSKIIINVIF